MNFRKHFEDLIESHLRSMDRASDIWFEVRHITLGEPPQGKPSSYFVNIGGLGVVFWKIIHDQETDRHWRVASFPVIEHPFTEMDVREMVSEVVRSIDLCIQQRRDLLDASV